MLRSSFPRPVFFGLALAGCGGPEAPVQASAPKASAPDARASGGVESDTVPGSAPGPLLGSVPGGELGRDELTGLYLSFRGTLGEEAALQPRGWTVEASGPALPAAGRFGAGLQLVASTALRCELPPEARALRAWTIECWLRVEDAEERDLLEVPGLVRLRSEDGGLLLLEVSGAKNAKSSGPVEIRHRVPLVEREWHHLALVLDLLDTRAVRMVLDGECDGVHLDPASLSTQPTELVLGDGSSSWPGFEGALDELRFEARALTTAALQEHGRLARGLPELPEPSALTDSRIDRPEQWARGELVHAWAGPEGLSWSPEHWRRIATVERPLPRTTHAVVTLSDRKLFLFGGETRDTHCGEAANTSDTWIFDGGTETWARSPDTPAPSPRCHVPAAYSPDHDLVLVFGGWWQGGWWSGSGPAAVYDDTWLYHVSEARWEQRFPAGRPPGRISDHGLVYLPEQRRFLLLTSRNAFLYDPQANAWDTRPGFEELDELGRPSAGAKIGTSMAVLDPDSGTVLLFGGTVAGDKTSFSDRTALYDPRTNRLTVLSPPVHPSARVRGALAYDPPRKRFVLFGGVRDQLSQRLDDLWTFDPATRRWSEVPPGPERPSARGGYFGVGYDAVADRFLVPFGREAADRWSDETWALELDEQRVGRARYLFDRGAFEQDLDWFLLREAPGDSAVEVRFRSGDDGLSFGDWSATCPAAGRFLEVELELRPGRGSGPQVRAMGFRARG